MEEVFPLTEQMNLLSETSRYALDNLLASHIINYNGTKSNAKISNNNSNIPNTNNNACNNDTCSPLLSKKRQQSQQSFSRLQTAQGMEYTGTSKMKKKNHVIHEMLASQSSSIYIHCHCHFTYSSYIYINHSNNSTYPVKMSC